jgi:DNA helicase-2/ATP-dependent DNA helicase PcrA
MLYAALLYLATPTDGGALARVYRDVWWQFHLGTVADMEPLRDKAYRAFSEIKTVEAFLWPAPGQSSAETLGLRLPEAYAIYAPDLESDIENFRQVVVRWLKATILPVDQLVLTISQEMFANPQEIALGYKIAQLLRSASSQNPHWRMPQFAEELRAISANERKFLGFDDSEQGFEPKQGRITIATMHAAKGLEWDRVYLMAVSNYGFPSAQPYDKYLSERWFVRDHLNLQAETLAQLRALVDVSHYIEGQATEQSRIDYAAERLRLLYVGITRAKRDLIITWNIGKFAGQNGATINQPALPLVALWEYVNGAEKV